jgi:hypothetical protein
MPTPIETLRKRKFAPLSKIPNGLGVAHTNGKSSFLKNILFFWTDIDPHMCCQSEAPVLCGIYKEISKNYPKCDSILLYIKKRYFKQA